MQSIDELVAQRKLLKEAEKAAKASGRSADWYLARPKSQLYVGLTNQGATCYLNSLVQGLYVCPELRESLYSFEYDPVLHGAEDSCVPLQLGRLFAELQLSTRHALTTRALTASFGWSQADAFRQHDAQELCRVLFEALAKFGLPSEELFQGRLKDTLRCLDCGFESTRSEAFSDVQLDVAGASSVEEALRGFVAWETMEGPDSWCCSACSARRSAKGSHFTSLPPLLMLQLKRFVFDVASMSRRKLNHRVSFPLTIDMASYLSPPPLDAAAEPAAPVSDLAAVAPAAQQQGEQQHQQEEDQTYECIGVLVHSGSAHGGHYFALLRPTPDADPPPAAAPPAAPPADDADAPPAAPPDAPADAPSGWFEFNDAMVRPATAAALEAAAGSGAPEDGGGGGSSGSSCYMLLYRRRSLGAPPPVPPPATLLRHAEREEEEAVRLRSLRAAAESLCELRLIAAHDTSAETTLTLHADSPAASLHERARAALLSAALPPPPPPPLGPGTPAALVAGLSVRGLASVVTAPQLRLRRWHDRWGLPEPPLLTAAALESGTLRSLGLAPRGTLLLESRPVGVHWPAPTDEDLYVRVRCWEPPGATATAPPPSTASAGGGGGSRDGDGAGAGAGDGECNQSEEKGVGQAEAAAGEGEGGGGFGPEHLVCVPGGLRPSASLALLREAVEAAFGVPAPLQRLVRVPASGAATLLVAAAAPGTATAATPTTTTTTTNLLEATPRHADNTSVIDGASRGADPALDPAPADGLPKGASSEAMPAPTEACDTEPPPAALAPVADGACTLSLLRVRPGDAHRPSPSPGAGPGPGPILTPSLGPGPSPSPSPSPGPSPSRSPRPNLKPGDEFALETAEAADAPSMLVQAREAARHRLKLSYNRLGSADLDQPLSIDSRATLADLKARIALRSS